RAEQEGAAVPEDLEWSRYSELDDEPDAAPEQESPAPAEPVWQAKTLATGIDPGSATLAVLDADGDGRPDLLAASAAGVQLFSAGATRVAPSGLEGLTGVLDVAPGDFDDDGRPDLAVVTAGGASLWRNAGGRFERFPVVLPAGSFRRAVWLDVDHDYDLDLILLGKGAAFVRNPGGGATEGWSDQTTKFPFAAGEALAAVAFHAVSDTQGMDLAVATADHAGILYRDRLGGRYEAEPLPALPAGTAYLEAGDADGDGWVDLLAGAAVLANDRGRSFAAKPAPAPPFALVDPGGSGRPRLVPRDVAALAAADFDGDLRTDLAEVTRKGELRLETNATPGSRRALAVRLAGVKNQKLALGAEVEVKAGSSYRKQTYRGVPLVFGLGARTSVDAVRVTWPNGLIQNETLLPSRPAGEPVPLAAVAAASPAGETITEAPRLSGSCPMIFTWDGDRFAFVTDVLGVAPLGASSGDGRYFPVDHDEHVRIPPGSLVAVDGRYDLRITEELREVTYLDQVRLLAVDHPAGVDVFTNDQFQDPPFPPLRFYAARERIRPIAARESEDGDGAAEDRAGRDVRERLLAVDRRYPDGFARDAAGVARLHRLDLDFGAAAPDGRAFLVLTGWVDWADGSTFLAAAQRPGGGLALPRVLVQDAAGRWVTAIPSMGIPSGKPKAIVVDMTGKWASRSRRVRIETNLCVYWDEIFLAPALEPDLRVTGLAPERAALRFRGFSRPVLDPERKQPEGFDYQSFQPVAMWNPTPGLYTRYGDVGELLSAVDDRFVIFGSGDEIRLAFSAAALPPVPAGWSRDLFLKVDGWAKDADANTAFSQSVEPLPFHAMTSYPYPPGEAYPDDPEHALYRRTYNVRPALRLIAPLRQEVAP
ncbi:MAG TPA: CRTAC1 family protein, partial [Thermoanaerobaculia bacterium]|nr:CRTAC1 family protein [Thermoanaerobaculia bacterium]